MLGHIFLKNVHFGVEFVPRSVPVPHEYEHVNHDDQEYKRKQNDGDERERSFIDGMWHLSTVPRAGTDCDGPQQRPDVR